MNIKPNNSSQLVDAFLTEQPLEARLNEARTKMASKAMGAVVTFEGVIRNHDQNKSVSTLTYTAHPSAEMELVKVVKKIVSQYTNIHLWVAHRLGVLKVGDLAFLVVASAPHRKQAFQICSEVVDLVKAQVPIWKQQEFIDGSTQWVGM